MYTWDLVTIKNTLNDLKKELKNNKLTENEKHLILAEYEACEVILALKQRSAATNKFLQKIKTKHKIREIKKIRKKCNIDMERSDVAISGEYLKELLEFSNFSSEIKHFKPVKFDVSYSDENIISLARIFFSKYGHEDIKNKVLQICNNKNKIDIKKIEACDFSKGFAISFNDMKRLKSHIYLERGKYNLALVELVEALATAATYSIRLEKFNKPSFNLNNVYADSIATAITLTFFDYLEDKGIDKNKVNRLRNIKNNSILESSFQANRSLEFKVSLDLKKRFKLSENQNKEIILKHLNQNIKKCLEKNMSDLIGIHIYEEYKLNKTKAFKIINSILDNKINKNQNPDLSKIKLCKNEIEQSFSTYGKKYDLKIKNKR